MHYLVETGKLKALNDTVDGFKAKNPGVTVNVTGMSLDQYTNTLNMKISAGDMPDVVFGNPKSYSNLVDAGNIMDITNEDFVKNVDSSAILDCTVKNKVYGVPMDLMLSGVIYNKDIFKKYSLSVPKTFDEFVSVMKTLKSNGVTPVAAGYKDLASVGGSYWCQSFGNYINEDPNMFADIMSGTKKPSDYPAVKQFLSNWKTINSDYISQDGLSVGVDRSEQDFASGKAAMIIIGSWAISSIRKYGPNGNFGAFLYPFYNDASKNRMQYNTDDTWMIAAKAQHSDLAKAFFSYMTTPDAGTTWANDVPAVSAINGAKPTKLDPILTDMDSYITSKQATNVDAGTILAGQFQTVWDTQMQAFCFTKKSDSIDSFLKTFDAAVDNARTTGK